MIECELKTVFEYKHFSGLKAVCCCSCLPPCGVMWYYNGLHAQIILNHERFLHEKWLKWLLKHLKLNELLVWGVNVSAELCLFFWSDWWITAEGLPAVNDDGAGSSSVALVHLPEERKHDKMTTVSITAGLFLDLFMIVFSSSMYVFVINYHLCDEKLKSGRNCLRKGGYASETRFFNVVFRSFSSHLSSFYFWQARWKWRG